MGLALWIHWNFLVALYHRSYRFMDGANAAILLLSGQSGVFLAGFGDDVRADNIKSLFCFNNILSLIFNIVNLFLLLIKCIHSSFMSWKLGG